ncbi:MAG: autotransporter domain-containing protein [Deltaproteobacteria bacterium]|jgi:uncharacterized protein with beta-barrel porin domain|nr:autotransporter domain-containing protein [Deltaproteobacteria bacterium]
MKSSRQSSVPKAGDIDASLEKQVYRVSFRLWGLVLALSLLWSSLAPSQVLAAPAYNADDTSLLSAFDTTSNDPSNHLNWDTSPTYSASWTGVIWVDVGSGDLRVKEIDISSQILSGNLDLNSLTSLTRLNVFNNALTLDVTHNAALTFLDGSSNALTALDVTHNTALTHLIVGDNALTALDVTHNTALTYLYAYTNDLTALDVTHNTALTRLDVDENSLTVLDVTHNTALTILSVGGNALTALDVSNNTALTELNVRGNALTALDVTHNTALTELSVWDNALTALDVTHNTALTHLSVGYNALTTLDVTHNTALTDLSVGYNALTTLDVTHNTALTYLIVSHNKLLLSQLYPMMGITNLNLGAQNGVIPPGLVDRVLLPNQVYSLNSEKTFNGVDTVFTLTLDSNAATNGAEYSLNSSGDLVFNERGVYQITMRNTEIHDNGFGSSLATVVTKDLEVAPAGSEIIWAGNDSVNLGVWTENASTHINNWLNYGSDIWSLATDKVTFDGNGVRTVDVDSLGVNPGTMTIAAGGYQFSGGAITGQTLVMKAADDTPVVINNLAVFSDGVSVLSGKLVLESSSVQANQAVEVNGGSLIVGGSAGSPTVLTAINDIHVANTGKLGGHGRIIGDVFIGPNGVLSPGNSIGITTITGDLTHDSGSFFDVEVDVNNPGDRLTNSYGVSDRVLVSGIASLAGALRVLTSEVGGSVADYVASGKEWLIIQANGGLSGEFERVTSDMAFLLPRLFYDPVNFEVWLSFVQGSYFSDYTTTYNQLAVSDAIETLNRSGDLYNILLTTKAGMVQKSLNSLSGEIYPTLKNALFHQDLSFVRTLSSRVSRSLAAASGEGQELLASLSPMVGVVRDNHFWATLEGSYLTLKDDGNAGKAELTGPEVSLGYDRNFPNGWFTGLAMKFADKRLKVDSRDSKADIKTLSFALYGGKEIPLGPGDLRILLLGELNRHDLDSERTALVGNNHQRLKADFHAYSYLAWLEGAYRLNLTADNTLEPFLAVGWRNLRLNSFRERGGNAALRHRGENWNHTLGSVGLRSLIKATDKLAVNLEAGYRHSFGKKYPESLLAFSDGGEPFRVRGVTLSRDEFQVATGLSYAIRDNVNLSLDYQGDFGSKAQSHVGGLSLKVSW